MLRYYIIIAVRNALRSKLFAIISVVGLALGLSASLMIGVYVKDELSYDRWIPGFSDIYRVAPTGSNSRRVATGPSDLGLWLRQDYGQIDEVARFFNNSVVVSKDNLDFNEPIA